MRWCGFSSCLILEVYVGSPQLPQQLVWTTLWCVAAEKTVLCVSVVAHDAHSAHQYILQWKLPVQAWLQGLPQAQVRLAATDHTFVYGYYLSNLVTCQAADRHLRLHVHYCSTTSSTCRHWTQGSQGLWQLYTILNLEASTPVQETANQATGLAACADTLLYFTFYI